MKSIFICHASQDKPFVRKLTKHLEKHGLHTWVDEQEIRVGESLQDKIEFAIRNADKFLVVLSKQSLKRPWVRRELKSAIGMELKNKSIFIMPAVIDNVKIPLFIEDIKYANFKDDFHAGVTELLKSLLGKTFYDAHNLETRKCQILIDIVRKDGSVAYYEKNQVHKCMSGASHSYEEALFVDGRIDNLSVDPGKIGNRRVEAGTEYIETIFPHAVRPDRTLKRRFRARLINAFLRPDEYWVQKQRHPSSNIEVIIRFPKSRPPNSWSAVEQQGARELPLDGLEFTTFRGKPALRVLIGSCSLLSNYIVRWSW